MGRSFGVYFDDEFADRVDEYCRRTGVKFSTFAATMIKRHLTSYNTDSKEPLSELASEYVPHLKDLIHNWSKKTGFDQRKMVVEYLTALSDFLEINEQSKPIPKFQKSGNLYSYDQQIKDEVNSIISEKLAEYGLYPPKENE